MQQLHGYISHPQQSQPRVFKPQRGPHNYTHHTGTSDERETTTCQSHQQTDERWPDSHAYTSDAY